jgi:hypothetical protein
MQCYGQHIRWEYIIKLYERNVGATTVTPGLSMVPKLKYEHIKLTSFSKMRVDLAAQVTKFKAQSCNTMQCLFVPLAQVLSESVSQALYLTGGGEAFETAYFIGMVDKFFDCLNVVFYEQGRRKRKPFQQPYRSKHDFRLKVAIIMLTNS